MANPSTSRLPYPELHPLVTPDDKGPAITIAAAFCMSLMLLSFGVRLWTRYPFKSLLGYDDCAVGAGSFVAVVQATLIMIGVRYGLGHKSDGLAPGHEDLVLVIIYGGSILYVLALCLGKLAVLLLLLRLPNTPNQRLAARVLVAGSVAWGAGSVFVIALREDIKHPWNTWSLFASSTLVRWVVVEAVGLVWDVSALGFITYVVWNLHVTRQKKIAIVTGFVMRLPIIPIAAARLYFIYRARLEVQSNPLFANTLPESLTQLEMNFNLIAATIPSLPIFLQSFTSGYLSGVGLDASDNYFERSAAKGTTNNSLGNSGLEPNDGSFELQLRVNKGGAQGRRENDAASDGSANTLLSYRGLAEPHSNS